MSDPTLKAMVQLALAGLAATKGGSKLTLTLSEPVTVKVELDGAYLRDHVVPWIEAARDTLGGPSITELYLWFARQVEENLPTLLEGATRLESQNPHALIHGLLQGWRGFLYLAPLSTVLHRQAWKDCDTSSRVGLAYTEAPDIETILELYERNEIKSFVFSELVATVTKM